MNGRYNSTYLESRNVIIDDIIKVLTKNSVCLICMSFSGMAAIIVHQACCAAVLACPVNYSLFLGYVRQACDFSPC